MMHQGYIKLFRRLKDKDIWLKEKFTRGQAWVDLLMLANHKIGFIRKRGIRVDLKRGDIGWSERELSKRWKWSRNRVRRFLSELCSENESKLAPQTIPQKNNVTSLYNITNYDLYQGDGTTNDTTDGPQTDRKRYQNKNDKNDKNNNICPQSKILDLFKKNFPTSPFPRLWNGDRSANLKARWSEDEKRQSLEWWQKFFNYIKKSPFLMSQVEPKGDYRQFILKLDWLVKRKNFLKVLEGDYHR